MHHLRRVVLAAAASRAPFARHICGGEGFRRSAAVAVAIHVHVEGVGDCDPDPDVELAALQQQRTLHVLLHHPLRPCRNRGPVHHQPRALNRHQRLLEGGQLSHDLDALALVQVAGFDQPHVLGAVLHRHALAGSSRLACSEQPEMRTEGAVVCCALAGDVAQNERGGHVVERLQPHAMVIVQQATQQAGLAGDALHGGKMIHQLPRRCSRRRRIHTVQRGDAAGAEFEAKRGPPHEIKAVAQQGHFGERSVPTVVHARIAAEQRARHRRADRAFAVFVRNRGAPPRSSLERASNQVRIVAKKNEIRIGGGHRPRCGATRRSAKHVGELATEVCTSATQKPTRTVAPRR
jgi:hypothetical protein